MEQINTNLRAVTVSGENHKKSIEVFCGFKLEKETCYFNTTVLLPWTMAGILIDQPFTSYEEVKNYID